MKSISRYLLYRSTSLFLNNQDEKYKELAWLFLNCANLIKGMENFAKEENYNALSFPDSLKFFNEQLEANLKNSNFEGLNSFIKRNMRKRNETAKRNSYLKSLANLFMDISNYQNSIISSFVKDEALQFESQNYYEDGKNSKVFLSYAYIDKGLTLSLFYWFLSKDIFLYVDWMWHSSNPNGIITKSSLNNELNTSDQFLFLRTPRSELGIARYKGIRQWCSWEIGNFYCKRKDEKYYINSYDIIPTKNDMLDSFKPMIDVVGGKII